MSEFKVGDWVEIKFKAQVRYRDTYRDESIMTVDPEGNDKPNDSVWGMREKWATKIDPPIPPVEAGDYVNGIDAHKLPIGSVVLYEPGGAVHTKVSDIQWISVGPDTSVVNNTTPYEPVWRTRIKLKVLHVGKPAS